MAEPALKVVPPRPAPRRASRAAKRPEEWIELSCPDWSQERSKEPVVVELRSIDLEDVDTEVRAPDSAIRPSFGGVARVDERQVSASRVDPNLRRSFSRVKWLSFGVIIGSVVTALLFFLLGPRFHSELRGDRESVRATRQPTAVETQRSVSPMAIGKKTENGITPTSGTGKQASPNAVKAGKANRGKPNGVKPSTSMKTKRALTPEKATQH